MSADELTDRIAAAATGVNLADLANRRLDAEQVGQMQTGLERVRKWPLTLDDRVQTVAHIKRGVRNQTRDRAGLGLVIIDYLQLLSSADAGKVSRQEVVSGMSRSMKLLAREHNVPVVLLAQLNRESTRRENKQPAIHDLRESGAVEQDSDEIILLHRDDDDPNWPGRSSLHLAKNRHGPTGFVRLVAALHLPHHQPVHVRERRMTATTDSVCPRPPAVIAPPHPSPPRVRPRSSPQQPPCSPSPASSPSP
jgi:replicative DNA helicase